MKVTPIPAHLQALSPQPTAPKTQGPPPAVQAAKQVLAARKATEAHDKARGKAPGQNAAPPPRVVVVPKSPQEALASDLPRGSLLDIVI